MCSAGRLGGMGQGCVLCYKVNKLQRKSELCLCLPGAPARTSSALTVTRAQEMFSSAGCRDGTPAWPAVADLPLLPFCACIYLS